MKPILFKIGTLEFPSYTLMVMLGILAATFVGYKIAQRRSLSLVAILDLAILGIILGFVGARLAHVLVEAPMRYLQDPKLVFYFWEGGFVSWGAHLMIFCGWIFYLRWRKLPVWLYLDVAAQALLISMVIGRIGCLLNGCCFGKPTDLWFGLDSSGISRHPTQIYLIVNPLIVQMVILWVARKHWKFDGQLISLAFILYAIGRFVVEFFRGDADRGVYFDGLISSGQIVMVFYFLLGIGMYWTLQRRGRPV